MRDRALNAISVRVAILGVSITLFSGIQRAQRHVSRHSSLFHRKQSTPAAEALEMKNRRLKTRAVHLTQNEAHVCFA